jgi:hypothetical protein
MSFTRWILTSNSGEAWFARMFLFFGWVLPGMVAVKCFVEAA